MGLLKTRTFSCWSVMAQSSLWNVVSKDAAERFSHNSLAQRKGIGAARRVSCITTAGDNKGDERKAFMSECLKAD